MLSPFNAYHCSCRQDEMCVKQALKAAICIVSFEVYKMQSLQNNQAVEMDATFKTLLGERSCRIKIGGMSRNGCNAIMQCYHVVVHNRDRLCFLPKF